MNTKFKVLCLHGYQQNKESFIKKSGAFRKLIKKYCEFGKKNSISNFQNFLKLH
jgi:hypothetical protein